MAYWLMKSEPDEFGIDDLALKKCERWDGVRNYQARNFMREMQEGDFIFMHHSSCKTVGIAGVMTVARAGYPDPSAEDPSSAYFDKKQPSENRWTAVDVAFEERFAKVLTLEKIKQLAVNDPRLSDLMLLSRSRLSVMPISHEQWQCLMEHVR